MLVLESGDRTRMIVNLVESVPFQSTVAGRNLTLRLGEDSSLTETRSPTTDVLRTDANRVERVASQITDLAFQRSPKG